MATHDLAHAALTWALMLALVVPGSFAPRARVRGRPAAGGGSAVSATAGQ
jgi:hypothetical protein